MNKNVRFLVPLVLFLTSCTANQPNDTDLETVSIICPTGAPAIALSCFGDSLLETTSNPSLLKGYFAAETYSVIVAPTDVGVKAIQEGCKYELAATITFGNFYIASTGLDDDSTIDSDDSIVLFQQGALPDKIFHYIYGNDFDSNITYVNNVQTAANSYLSKEVTTADGNKKQADYVLLAEPKLTALGIEENKIINLSQKFREKSQTSNIHQASVFIGSKFKSKNFLSQLKTNIDEMVANSDTVVQKMSNVSDPQTFYGIPPQVAANCMKKGSLGIGFEYSKENKQSIQSYLSILGMGEVDESIFYE